MQNDILLSLLHVLTNLWLLIILELKNRKDSFPGKIEALIRTLFCDFKIEKFAANKLICFFDVYQTKDFDMAEKSKNVDQFSSCDII